MTNAAQKITSLQNPGVKEVVKLSKRSARDEAGLLLVEGYRELKRALENGWKPVSVYFCPELYLGKNEPALIQREGRGFCFRVSQARQPSTIRPNTVVDQGIWADCISTIHPITASRNNVSRLSRGSAPSQGRLRNQSRGEELAGSVFMRAHRSGAAVDQGHW